MSASETPDRSRNLPRDTLYELEMCRALLGQATVSRNFNPVLVRGLEREVAWWAERAVQGCTEPPRQ